MRRSSPLLILLMLSANAPGSEIELAPDTLRIDAESHAFEMIDGRRVLQMKNGRAWLEGVDLTNGAIEFDLRFPEVWSFHGVLFRAIDERNFEEVYLRPSQSGRDDAIQYTPVTGGVSGWQLYFGPGYWANRAFAFDRWLPVRLEFRGQALKLFVDSDEPVLEASLLRDAASGGIALRASLAEAWFSNLRVTPLDDLPTDASAAPDPDPGVITDWSISAPFAEADLAPRLAADPSTWRPAQAGPGGVLDIARHAAFVRETGNTVYARTPIPRGDGGPVRVDFGYSDRVVVFYNGRRIYAGDNGWRTRDFRYLGSIGRFDSVYVDRSEAATNELIFAVSETFGGWGVTAALGVP